MTNDDLVSTACRAIWSEGDVSRRGALYKGLTLSTGCDC